MPFRYHGFALAFALLAGPAGAFAQPPNDDPSTLQTPLNGPDFFTVTRVDPDGTIVLGPSATIPAQFRDNLGTFFAEGIYLLVTNDGQPVAKRRVIRAQVTDVAAGSVFTLKTGPQAAARVQMKDSARLVRPVPVTTARLRALPDEIPFQVKPADANPDANPDDAREIAARARSINNLQQMGLAMHNFHASNTAFPPAVIYGPDGKPWHSWRVLILPYLESIDLYNAYDFSQPWDSPKNKPLIDKMPAVYRDPIHGDNKEPYTHYAALVGPAAIFRPDGAKQTNAKETPLGKWGLGLESITDGTSNTVMISSVEPGRKIPWTKPEDIDAGPRFKGFGHPGGIAAPYTFHGPGGGKAAPFAFADGSVRMIGASVNPRTLEALITCGGNEVIPSDSYPAESGPLVPQIKTLKIRLSGGKATATIE
jgi:prepilin-type processing-associated H-X9-DG protein